MTITNQDTPVDIAVTDLVDVYTEDNGILISDTNVVSVKFNNGNSGVKLSVDESGLRAEIMIKGEDVN